MNPRRFAVNSLYGMASALCQLADWLAPTTDDIWRDRQWKRWGKDFAKRLDGPPLDLDDRVEYTHQAVGCSGCDKPLPRHYCWASKMDCPLGFPSRWMLDRHE